ncbi:GLUG motif-containing protein, partial [Segatella copri]|uniref:GLUG motif-containing protein n=1 Tax=Segatella copri TaxID=165179 RepID=UPI0026468562
INRDVSSLFLRTENWTPYLITNNMKTNFVKLRWLFTMLLFVTTMIMPTMMLAKSIDLKIPEGDGAGTPYKIGTAEELYWFAGLVNGTLPGVKKDLSANAILTDDIIVNTGVLDPNKDLVSGNDFIEWIPIGKSSSDDDAYTGTFDGNGHTISGLYFNKSNSWYVGLFGCIGAEGKISNVGVSDSYFQSSNCPYIGGVCGSNSGELQNCSNSSTVIGKENEYRIGGVCGYNSGTVKDCKNTGSVRGKETIGGVCGYNERRYNEKGGIIENSFNEGTVSGTGDYDVLNIGGVCGYNYGGTIKSCYNTASVSVTGKKVGGVGGDNSDGTSTITNCFNEGTVRGKETIGGVCGNNSGTIKNCYNTASVSGQYSVGGVCGDNYEGPITNCYYLSGTVADGKGGIGGKDDENGKAVEMSKDRFKSGEVAWLLNGSKSVSTEGSTLAWYQKLDENADAYPVLKSTDHNTVYKAPLFSCDGTTRIGEYANKPEGDKLSHNYQMAEKADEGTSNLYSEECAICHN